MSGLVEVSCTACQTPLKFRPKSSPTVALTCPKCNHLFEVKLQRPAPRPIVEPALVKAVEVVQPAALDAAPATATPQNSVVDNLTDNELPAPSLPVRPVVRSQANTRGRKKKGQRGISPLAAIFAGLAGIGLLLTLLILFATDAGQSMIASLTSTTNTPEGIARKRNAIIEDCLIAVSAIESDSERTAAADKLSNYRETLSELVYAAVKVPSIDDANRQTLQLEMQKGDTQLANSNLDLDRLVAGRSDDLAKEIQTFRNTSETIKLLLLEVAHTLREPTEREERICYEGLVLEKEVLQNLATIRTAEQVEPTLQIIQGLTDKFNQMAEEQYASGYRVSFPPRDYDRVETAVETARRWLVDNIEETLQPEREFQLTIKDFDYIQNRFDNALFKSSIVNLDSTSRERVQNEVASSVTPDSTQFASNSGSTDLANTPSNSDLASNYSTQESGNDLTDAGFNQFDDAGTGFDSDPYSSNPYGSRNTSNSPYDNEDFSNNLSGPDLPGPTGGPFGPGREKRAGSDKSEPGRTSPGGIGREAIGRNEQGLGIPESDFGSSPGSMLGGSSRGGFSSDREQEADNRSGTLSETSSRAKPGSRVSNLSSLLTGRNSLTVRIINGNNLDGPQLLKRMSTKLGGKQSKWLDDNGELVLNFEYSGSLQNASKAVDFGKVELSDSQSRTLFVAAD